jgi:hypothetical protein
VEAAVVTAAAAVAWVRRLAEAVEATVAAVDG